MFGTQPFGIQQPPGNQPTFGNQPPLQVNLRETDAVTELCNVAAAVVPHPLNTEYRLKKAFVDATEKKREPTQVPVLSPHEHIQAAHQAQSFGVHAESWTPTEAVGFAGLKARFDAQQKAIKEQDDMIAAMKDRIVRESNAYKNNCQERLNRLARLSRECDAELIELFKKSEGAVMQQAAAQGNKVSKQTAMTEVSNAVYSTRRDIDSHNLEARVRALQQDAMMQETSRNDPPVADGDERNELKKTLLRQTKERTSDMKNSLSQMERELAVMRGNRDS